MIYTVSADAPTYSFCQVESDLAEDLDWTSLLPDMNTEEQRQLEYLMGLQQLTALLGEVG